MQYGAITIRRPMKKNILMLFFPVLMQAQYQIGMYYQSWSYANGGAARIQKINLTGLTYIVHIDGGGGTDVETAHGAPYYGALSNSADSIALFWRAGENVVDSLVTAAHRVGAKALLCVGTGWGTLNNYPLEDSTRCQTLIDAICAFARRHNYDGLELDWEATDKEPISWFRFIRRLKARLDTWNPAGWLTCAAGYGDVVWYPGWMKDCFTFMGIQTYDLTSNNDNVTGYNAPLFPPASPSSLHDWQDSWAGWWNAPEYYNDGQPRGGPRLWVANGWPANKLICGVPQYGYLYEDVDSPGQSQTNRRTCNYNFARLAQLHGGTRHWDATSKVPWIGGVANADFGDDWWNGNVANCTSFYVTYDDTVSYAAKVQYVKDSGYAGIFMYDAGTDWDGTNYLTLAQSAVRYFASTGTSVENEIMSTTKFLMEQNYPNPFNPSTVINYQLSAPGKLRLSVCDILGRDIVTLVDEEKGAGNYTATLNGAKLSSGVYFARLVFHSVNGKQLVQVKKLLVVK